MNRDRDRDQDRGAVVVAIDDDGSAGDAVDWAAAEAATRGCPLQVVHALRPQLLGDPCGSLPARSVGELLRDAVARARTVASDLSVSTRLVRGSAARALIGEAQGAGLLVVGSHDRSGLRGMLAGSVSVHVATNAPCPVVVRASDGEKLDRAAPDALARVVVGIGTAPSSTPEVGFAFEAARQRGIPLNAVHAWTSDTAADVDGASGGRTLAEFFGRRSTEKVLARWRDEYAGVQVVTTLSRGDPASVLVAESRGAALLVVGSRGRGRLRGVARGSVSQIVRLGAHCPIAIVRHGGTAAAGAHHRLAS